jgi:hypothetical protein
VAQSSRQLDANPTRDFVDDPWFGFSLCGHVFTLAANCCNACWFCAEEGVTALAVAAMALDFNLTFDVCRLALWAAVAFYFSDAMATRMLT